MNESISNCCPPGEANLQSVSSTEGDFTIDFEYELNEQGKKVELGKGSFGVVLSGVDLVTRKKMAIKEIPTGEATNAR